MKSKMKCRIAVATAATAVVFGAMLDTAHGDVFWNGSTSSNWSDAANWTGGHPSSGPGNTVINPDGAFPTPVVSTAGNTTVGETYVSVGAGLNIVAGGDLTTVSLVTGIWGDSALVSITGGALTMSSTLNIGAGAYNGDVSISGGTVTAANLSINTTGGASMDISGSGSFIAPISNLGNINYWIDNNAITANGGTAGWSVNVDTTTSPGNIILTSIQDPNNWLWNGNVSQDWSNGNNFNFMAVPVAGSLVFVEEWASVREPLINNGGHAPLGFLGLNTNMTIASGGSLVVTNLDIALNSGAELAVTGGSLTVDGDLDVAGYNGATARFNVSGGTATVGRLLLNLDADTDSVGGSQVDLSGGTVVSSGALSINSLHPALLNISGGALVLPTSELNNVNFWISRGDISGYGVGVSTNEFSFDLASVPGSAVITALNSAITAASFQDYDPQLMGVLPPALDQSMSNGVPAGLSVLAESGFSFGTAVGIYGEVYFTDYPGQKISRYDPSDGSVTVVVSSRPGVYGIATDAFGNLFYAQESTIGNGTVTRRTSGGAETTIITGLTRPRQLTTDSAGNLYVALEAEREILKWEKTSGTVSTFVDSSKTPGTPQGVAMAPDGRLYMSGYGYGAGRGTLLLQGAVWVRETDGTVNLVAGGFSRARGLALHPNGDLYLNTEANPWDNGNSGLFVRIDTNGVVTRVVEGVDYPQFPSIGADGRVYTTLARDGKLVSYDPANDYALQAISTPGVGLTTEGAAWQNAAGENLPFELTLTNTNNPADNMTITGYLDPDPAFAEVGMWFNVPATNFSISLDQIPNAAGNTNSGHFELPEASVTWSHNVIGVDVVALREHQRCRWPMSNVGDPTYEAPAADFAETPESYLVYVRLEIPPVLAIQPWSGSQVRISWPVSESGHILKKAPAVHGPYVNSGLAVTVEGDEKAAYDAAGDSEQFYRLYK